MVVCFGVLTEAALNTANVTDTIAEQQAHNAAESGIQTAVNVMRGNTVPNPLLDPSKPASHPSNKIDFAKAIKLSTSNSDTDTSVEARLSRLGVTVTLSQPKRLIIRSTDYGPRGAANELANAAGISEQRKSKENNLIADKNSMPENGILQPLPSYDFLPKNVKSEAQESDPIIKTENSKSKVKETKKKPKRLFRGLSLKIKSRKKI